MFVCGKNLATTLIVHHLIVNVTLKVMKDYKVFQNILYREKFALLKSRAIHICNALDLDYCIKPNKKYFVHCRIKKIHSSDSHYLDYLIHEVNDKRRRYRMRISRLQDKNGSLRYLDRNSPLYWCFHLLW